MFAFSVLTRLPTASSPLAAIEGKNRLLVELNTADELLSQGAQDVGRFNVLLYGYEATRLVEVT